MQNILLVVVIEFKAKQKCEKCCFYFCVKSVFIIRLKLLIKTGWTSVNYAFKLIKKAIELSNERNKTKHKKELFVIGLICFLLFIVLVR